MTTHTESRAHIKLRKPKSNLIFSIKKIKNQKKWTREEDELLIYLAEKYNEKHWKEISKRFAKKNSLQCFSRYKRIRPGIVKGSWKKDEDQKIIDLVNKHGKAWSKISKILGSRNGKQIRDRFINVLDPEIKKGKFSEEEDRKLVVLFKQYGPKWATIAKYYPNRTADMIKNRFHSSIKKRIGGDPNEKYDDKDSIKEEFPTFNKNKDLIPEYKLQISPSCSSNNFSLQSTLGSNYSNYSKSNSLIGSPTNDLIMQEMDSMDNKNFNSTYSSKDMDSDFYPQNANNFNYDNMMNCEREIKTDDVVYGGGAFIWNFEDYFTI